MNKRNPITTNYVRWTTWELGAYMMRQIVRNKVNFMKFSLFGPHVFGFIVSRTCSCSSILSKCLAVPNNSSRDSTRLCNRKWWIELLVGFFFFFFCPNLLGGCFIDHIYQKVQEDIVKLCTNLNTNLYSWLHKKHLLFLYICFFLSPYFLVLGFRIVAWDCK